MKRLVIGLAVVVCLLGAGVADAAKINLPDARSEARLAALSFGSRHHLYDSNVGRCKRRSSSSVVCQATVKGETASATKECRLTITVRAVAHRFYTSEVAAITKHRCITTPKEQLTYAAAHESIQGAADAFAGTPTTISSMLRIDELTYSASAKWERPSIHPTEYSPTESCSVELTAKLAGGKVSVATESFYCF